MTKKRKNPFTKGKWVGVSSLEMQELPRFRGWSAPMTCAERRHWERYAVGRFLGVYFRMKPQSPNA